MILRHKFKYKTDFYLKPCPPSMVNIYKVEKLSEVLEMWPLEEIQCKRVILPNKNKYLILPLIHSDKL